jgi:hypothetical protein
MVAALTLRLEVVGSAYLVTGLGVLVVAFGTRRRRPGLGELLPALGAVLLLCVGVVRSAEWLVVLSLLGAMAVGTLGLVGARTWTGVVVGAVVSTLAPVRAARWVVPTLARCRVQTWTDSRRWLVGLVSGSLLVIFGELFATADPAYAALVDAVFPALDVPDLMRRGATLCVVVAVAVVASYLAVRPPTVDALAPSPGRPVRRGEWVVPLVVLDALFLSFVVVQLSVLFGGQRHVLGTRGLTYAEYARQGFWQLLVVTALTLVVVAVAVRTAARATAAQRALVRGLLGLLCLLSLVVVASAMHRMALYQQEYGYTRLRLFIDVVELALGSVFVLVLVAGVRMTGTWLPRAVVVLVSVALLSLAVVNPDAYIARHNVARFEQNGRIDTAYLANLSPDAVPALVRLPMNLRACALSHVSLQLRGIDDHWYDVNLARSRARRLLAGLPLGHCAGR